MADNSKQSKKKTDSSVGKKRKPLDPAKCKALPWRPRKYNEEECNRLALELINWAKTDDAVVIEMWLGLNGLHRENCARLCRYSENFRDALNLAKRLIGARRETLALYGKVDAGIVKKSAAMYNPEVADWELKLRGMDNHAVNRALNIMCRGAETSIKNKESEVEDD